MIVDAWKYVFTYKYNSLINGKYISKTMHRHRQQYGTFGALVSN